MLKKGKLDANTVGAGFVSDRNKGITLIALIITIIVMLILVGVTVNVALNGGLFEKAKQGVSATQKEADKEELTLLVISKYEVQKGEVDFTELNTIISNAGWSGTDGVYTSPNGNTFYVSKKGNIANNIWSLRGITSSNVKYDKKYSNPTITYGTYTGIELTLFSDGGISYDFGGIEVASLDRETLDSIPNLEENLYGNENFMCMHTSTGFIGLIYNDDGTADMYFKDELFKDITGLTSIGKLSSQD